MDLRSVESLPYVPPVHGGKWERLAPDAAGLDKPGDAQPAQVPRHERLAEPDALDQLGDRGLALGEPLDDPQAVHVGEGLVDDAQRAELVGLVERRRDGRANVRGRWGQAGRSDRETVRGVARA